ncbi:MAG: hypothetical protein H6686_01925 [Fibrobacteria bacterium]|nr:hypothetical protein [Fibrobacteria bacterium]
MSRTFVFALVCSACLAPVHAQLAWRAVPHAELGYGSDGGGMNGDWTVGAGIQAGAGFTGTLYVPKEDSMGWALQTNMGVRSLSGDLEGTMKVPDGARSGATMSQMTGFAHFRTGPFYRFLGLWGASGGQFGVEMSTTEGETNWFREDYSLLFAVFSEGGTDPWANQGVRCGVMLGRLGGDQVWSGLYDGKVTDSLEWLREGFVGEGSIEYWQGHLWGQLVGSANSTTLRHRSEEGSRGEGTNWSLAIRLGYRFAWGDLGSFR